ncbi:MAG TPA: Gfo/Idh/MocA family oxidoreductase [Puia sp.]|jgi:predicted dehydrogenase
MTLQKKNQLNRRQFITRSAALSAIFIVPRHVLGRGFTAPSDRISLGFIGCGRQGHTLQGYFLKTEEVQITGACDVYADKRRHFAAAADEAHAKENGLTGYKGCTQHADFRELLDRKDIDAVVIAAPDHWHAALAVRAAEAGKDIYGEKPLSLTIREGRAMVDAVRKHDRIFQAGSMQRSWPEFRQAVELVRNGYIGKIKTVKVSVGGPPVPYNLPAETIPDGLDWNFWLGPNAPVAYNSQLAPVIGADLWARWRDFQGLGGGDMTDWGAHMFDIVQWGLDKDDTGPVTIVPPDGKEHPFLTYYYSDGITVTHENFGKPHAVRFIGTEGQLDIQRHKLTTSPETLKDKVIGPGEHHVYFSDNHYKDFLNSVRKRTRPICDIETGHRSATVCNLGNIAYALKRPLKWDPVKEEFHRDKEANRLRWRHMRKEWRVG